MNSNERLSKQAYPRKRGGQPGNQNARKHGFYATFLTPSEQNALQQAAELKNLDPEVALLRVKLMSLVASPAAPDELIIKAIRTLTRMLDVQRRLLPTNLGFVSSEK